MSTIPKETHSGVLKIGEMEVQCAVLASTQMRVVSQRSFAEALGAPRGGDQYRQKKLADGGAEMPIFLASPALKPFISQELAAALSSPIVYVPRRGGRTAYGVEAKLIPEICDVWLRARDANALTTANHIAIAKQAEVLMRGLAHIGITALVDEATGYQLEREADALQRLLAVYLSEERLTWAKRFPNEFYKELFRLRKWAYNPMSVKRPRLVGFLTNQIVYKKLPPGVLEKLQELNPKDPSTGRRVTHHHRHLSESVGQPDLHAHLLQLIAVMRVSPNWNVFKRNFARAFPAPEGQQQEIEEIDEDEDENDLFKDQDDGTPP